MRRAPVKQDAEALRRLASKNDYRPAALKALDKAAPAQIEQYIDVNVTDLASAKVVMKQMLRLLVALYRHSQVRDD